MGTEIITWDDCEETNTNLLFKRFGGGVDRGTMYSLMLKNAPQDHMELSEKDFLYIVYKKFKLDFDEIQDKDTLYTGHIRFIRAVKPLLVYLEKKYGFNRDGE